MIDHVWMDIPDDYRLRKRLSSTYKQACWVCGKFSTGPGLPPGYDCKYYMAQSGWMWGPGQPDDPFASMRTNGKAMGATLGSQGVGGHGMPIRKDVPVPEPGGTVWSKPAEAETRPGLAPEAIDWEAFKTFGKGL